MAASRKPDIQDRRALSVNDVVCVDTMQAQMAHEPHTRARTSVRSVLATVACRGPEVDLNSFIVAAAPYGGPIALTRDPTKFTALSSSGLGAADKISIYSSSGRLVGERAPPCSRCI
jgi:hypothetical protein